MKMSSLLDALKGSKPSMDDDEGEPIGMKVSVLKAKPVEEHGDDDESPLKSLFGGMGDDPDEDHDNDTSPMGDADDDMGDTKSNTDSSAHDTQVVDALQERFPEIYAEICKQIDHAGHGDE